MEAPHYRELTPRGRGAIAVVAVTGEGALELVRRLVPTRRLAPGGLAVVRLAAGAESGDAAGSALVDEAVVAALAPDRVELCLHGSPAVVDRLGRELERLGAARARAPAASGEVERAAAELARARTEAAARVLLDQAEGALGRELDRLCGLDPPRARAALDALAERGRWTRHLLRPTRVVLAGPVNAGKSTLFNALLGHERALASEEPGTTRDAIVEPCALGAWPVELVDTAGARALDPVAEEGAPGADRGRIEVERAGQAVAAEEGSRADLVLWLSPAGAPVPPPSAGLRARVVPLASLADRAPRGLAREPRSIAAGPDPEGARDRCERVLRETFDLPADPWRPGRGVPIRDGWEEVLGAARGAIASQERRRVLAPLRSRA